MPRSSESSSRQPRWFVRHCCSPGTQGSSPSASEEGKGTSPGHSSPSSGRRAGWRGDLASPKPGQNHPGRRHPLCRDEVVLYHHIQNASSPTKPPGIAARRRNSRQPEPPRRISVLFSPLPSTLPEVFDSAASIKTRSLSCSRVQQPSSLPYAARQFKTPLSFYSPSRCRLPSVSPDSSSNRSFATPGSGKRSR